MSFNNPVTGGQGTLIRPAIKSSNFVHNVSGWTINRDGSAEFNNGTFRGTVTASTFQGTDFVITTNGEFFYSGAPASGNMIASIAPANGDDGMGNLYLTGFTTYDHSAQTFTNVNGGAVVFGPLDAFGNPVTANEGFLLGAGGGVGQLELQTPVTAGFPDALQMTMNAGAGSAPVGGSGPSIVAGDAAGTSFIRFLLKGALEYQTGGGVAPGWQLPGFATNWATADSAGTYGGLQYRIDGFDNVEAVGAVHMTLAAGLAAGTYTINNPVAAAAYRPAKTRRVAAVHASSANVIKEAAMFTLTSAGIFQVTASAAIAQNDAFFLAGTFPLGNIS